MPIVDWTLAEDAIRGLGLGLVVRGVGRFSFAVEEAEAVSVRLGFHMALGVTPSSVLGDDAADAAIISARMTTTSHAHCDDGKNNQRHMRSAGPNRLPKAFFELDSMPSRHGVNGSQARVSSLMFRLFSAAWALDPVAVAPGGFGTDATKVAPAFSMLRG
jgi:hypothetical protein